MSVVCTNQCVYIFSSIASCHLSPDCPYGVVFCLPSCLPVRLVSRLSCQHFVLFFWIINILDLYLKPLVILLHLDSTHLMAEPDRNRFWYHDVYVLLSFFKFTVIWMLCFLFFGFKVFQGFSSLSFCPFTTLKVISKSGWSLSLCQRLFKTNCNSRKQTHEVWLHYSGYLAPFRAQDALTQRCPVWSLPFVKSLCLELKAHFSQVTSVTAFDSLPLFSNQKRVSVWVSLKACLEIGSTSLYTHQTGTVCNLTGSRSSQPSSNWAPDVFCFWVWMYHFAVCEQHMSQCVMCMWNTIAQSICLFALQQHIFTVHDIIYPSDVLMIISFSPSAKETPLSATQQP